MGRAPCCDKANVKKGPWSPEEDAKLKSYIEQHGTGGNWIALPQKIGLKRCGKSCRLRWLNYLRPNIKHGGFTEEEENIICSLYISIGSRWSIIAAQLPGRTDNDIKNYWNTRLKKKLMAKQRKEQEACRAAGLINHEMKRESGNYLVTQTPNQIPYNLVQNNPLLASLQTMHYPSTQDPQLSKILMKIGGQYYHHDDSHMLISSTNNGMNYDYPIQDQIYGDVNLSSCNLNGSNYAQWPTNEYDMNPGHGLTNFPADVEAYLNSLLSFEGSTSFSDTDGGNNSNSTTDPSTSATTNSSWVEMSSLVNTPVSQFDVAYQQGMLQKVAQ